MILELKAIYISFYYLIKETWDIQGKESYWEIATDPDQSDGQWTQREIWFFSGFTALMIENTKREFWSSLRKNKGKKSNSHLTENSTQYCSLPFLRK